MKYRVPLLAAAVAGMLALSAGPALATTTLDQHQTDVSGYADAWQISNMRLAQTFTTGMAGSLSRVDINADAFGGSVTFEILGATYLDTQTVNLNDSGWTQINLKTPFNVVKGTYYYLIVVPNGKISWRGVCTNPYSGGKAYVLDGSWSTIPAWATAHHATLGYCEQDFAFRTYVTTATLATPKPTKAPTAKPGKTAAAVEPHRDNACARSINALISTSSWALGSTRMTLRARPTACTASLGRSFFNRYSTNGCTTS